MLAALALAGAAALVAGCAAQQAPTSTDPGTTDPGSPPVAISGADPAPLDGTLLQDLRVMDQVAAEGTLVRWLEPGVSIAIVLGGSGGGGECIPQPHAAALEPTAPSIVVRFDPPNPEVMCTADFTLHGWELALAEPVDAATVVPVRLVNMQGTEDVVETELGPDDVLESAVPTADPQPSVVPGTPPPGAAEPEEIPEPQLPGFDELLALPDPNVAVHWAEPGVSLAVFTIGSRAAPVCNAVPQAAWSTGPGTIEVAFGPNDYQGDCPADGGVWGWVFTLPEAVPATLDVEVTVTGTTHDGQAAVVTVAPDDVYPLD
ncbi:hypothetical protein ABA31_09610 [Agrococcus baldri]|uniref:Uncharacterized protein n=2 Tax=Agrococcus baldri TaxID=153730 RepID=A0AA87RAR7_9MICO|nr:hypothetical protein ABA31_09610 [Agrococcus baldri]